MDYEGQICQAPMERASFSLPVMVGCSYNQCKFCNLFRHLSYRELPMEQIDAELQRVYEWKGNPKKIFLGDGNAFGLKTERLLEILDRIHKYFPDCQCVNMDATITSILNKSDAELRELYLRGVRHLYIGIESGLDDVLRFMNKDHNVSQAYRAVERIQSAGLVFDAHIMTGVAGKGRGMENAEALAEFFNKTGPCNVVNFSMFLHKEVPLYQDIKNGGFIPASEQENLMEERAFIQRLGQQRGTIEYEGLHDFIEFRVRGTLPKDCEKMLTKLDTAIEKYKNTEPIYSYVYGECPHIEKTDTGEKVWCVQNR